MQTFTGRARARLDDDDDDYDDDDAIGRARHTDRRGLARPPCEECSWLSPKPGQCVWLQSTSQRRHFELATN